MTNSDAGQSSRALHKTVTLSPYDELYQSLRSQQDQLPARLRQIAEYITQHPNEVALGTVKSVALAAGVQPSTVVRFARVFSFNGFTDMQAVFQDHLRSRVKPYQERVKSLHRVDGQPLAALDVLEGFYHAASESLEALHHLVDPLRLQKAVECLSGGKTIYILGLRRSMSVVRYLSYLFTKMEIPHRVAGAEAGMEEESILSAGPDDAALVISFSDYAPLTVKLFKLLEAQHVPVVSLTDNAMSPVIPSSGLWLEIVEADFQGFRANAATMVMIMTLAAAVAERRKPLPSSNNG